jgi:hypothetical protein
VQEAERLWPREQQREGGTGGTRGGTRGEPGPGQIVTYAEARRRRELARAEREEYQLAVAQGRFASIDYLDQQLASALQGVRLVLLNLPGKIAPQMVGLPTVARAQIVLQQAIDEAMPTLQAIGEDPTLDAGDPPDVGRE